MKKTIILFILLFEIINLFGQQQGFSYQALIIDHNPEEIPGKNIEGNILPNHPLIMRFTILDSLGNIEYQEEQKTKTDKFGMINLVVGQGEPTASSPNKFSGIDWNGKEKKLKVSISLSQTNPFFTDFSLQNLTFVPYAYHKNITATGSMKINGVTTLNNRLNVAKGSSTFLSGDLTVEQKTKLKDKLTVNATSDLNGQVVINSTSKADKKKKETYPLLIKGSSQGIAIKINGSRNNSNYYLSFWDKNNLQGRIEGQTIDELKDDYNYKMHVAELSVEIGIATTNLATATASLVAASSSSTACMGVGACVTTPVPSLIIAAVADVAAKTASLAIVSKQLYDYIKISKENIGVSFQSGSGDYAEWLPKANANEKFSAGDIVGVKGGIISKNTKDADLLMVITSKAIVLGNMPPQGKENEYEKVSFIGQVPVRVFGKVNPGDYIIPSGDNDGMGKAISPDSINIAQMKKIVGIAWSSNPDFQYGFVNLAVGLKNNDVASIITKQQKKIKDLQNQIDYRQNELDQMNNALAQLLPDYADKMGIDVKTDSNLITKSQVKSQQQQESQPHNLLKSQNTEETIYYHKLTKEEVIAGIEEAKQNLSKMKKSTADSLNIFYKKLDTDKQLKNNFINNLLKKTDAEFHKTYAQEIKEGVPVINY